MNARSLAFPIIVLATLSACSKEPTETATGFVGGDFNAGRQKLANYGCISCHEIPGVTGANGLVGPPLEHMASRMYVAGVLQNTPSNLIRWVEDPPQVDPKTAMPNLHVTEEDARDIATYLYTLQ